MCEKLLRRPDAQYHQEDGILWISPQNDVCDAAHSDPGRGRALVMLLRCCMYGFMSDKVSSE